ncbi:hypothetical protein tb265_13520 [Gemmatimonadetes bacterium T265]|nr:hypothetical protein tb265_13520 [Gemmatimonadetes bacterium T265]
MSAAVAPDLTPLAPEPADAPAARPGGTTAPVTVAVRVARALRRHPIAATGVVLVAAGALAPAAGVRGLPGVPGAPAPAVALSLPAAYVALSPLARTADALCLLSSAQHAAVLATVVAAAAALRVAAARRRVWVNGVRIRERRSFPRAFGAECVAAALTLAFLLVAYAAAVLGPRPMAGLAVADPDLVRVDFHSHTAASHDVPAWITPAWRRAWHAAAGYDLAFVSDHRAIAGAAVTAGNPRRAGDGLSLLPALEARLGTVHVIVLGVTAADSALLPEDHMERVLPGLERGGALPSGARPVTIATIPDPVFDVLTPAARDGAAALRGVEVADGAPRGYGQADRDGAAIAARASVLGIVPVVASNHHGWGRTTAGWNLVRVPGWRAMTPDSLGAAVVAALRAGRRDLVTPVLRSRVAVPSAAPAGGPLGRAPALALTAPAVAWETARELTGPERVAWLAWIAAGTAAAAAAPTARRARSLRAPVRRARRG